jgi:stage II sporulation protein GA (sporulation sigma-E factor processing peptidase)
MMTNLFVLMATNLLMGGRIKILRLPLASGIGAGVSVAILYLGLGYGILYVALVIITDIVMMYIMGIYKRNALIGIVYMNVIAFAYSKLNDTLNRLAGRRITPLVAVALVTAIVIFTVAGSKISKGKSIYKVVLKEKGEAFETKALYDTGNLLTEPITGSPVSVIEKNQVLKNWIEHTPEKYKAIPYKSVGNDNGILEGMMIDQLIILHDNRQVVNDKAIIALYDGELSKDGSFQMILNHSLHTPTRL